jgi:hypothetical protein
MVTVSDSGNPQQTVHAPFGLTFNAAPSIGTGPLAPGVVNSVYEQGFSVTGGTAPYTWSMTGQPSTLNISGSGGTDVTATISGTPTAPATYPNVVVTVQDAAKAITTYTYSLTVNPAPVTTYSISGTVTTAGGTAAIPSATVTLWLNSTAANTVTTKADGSYSFASLAANTYSVSVTLCGYSFPAAPGTAVTLTSGQPNQTVNVDATGTAPTREYIRLGGRVIAIANCGAQ